MSWTRDDTRKNGQFIEFTPGAKQPYVQFSLPTDLGNRWNGIVGIDDRGDVFCYEYDPSSKDFLTFGYSPTGKTQRSLGRLSGSSCTQNLPLYVNASTRVLGIAQNCSFASDQTYWT